jgi:hypothetical protein
MKKILVIAAASMLASSAFAQGLLNWNTAAGTGSRFVYGSDCGAPYAGTTYNGSYPGSVPLRAAIWVGPAGSAESALTRVDTSIVTVLTSGIGIGNVTGMTSFAVPNYGPATTISLQVRAWSGAGYGQGALAGKSGVTQIVLGGPSPAPAVAAWSLTGVAAPTTWDGVATTGSGPLAGFQLHVVPEPATASLIGLGLASLLIFRRRN